MPKVTSLGHIGLHCNDFPTMLDFYTRVLGFTVTDRTAPTPTATPASSPRGRQRSTTSCC